MTLDGNAMTIIVADDDADDRLLINDAFQENHLSGHLEFVKDGEELMDYLQRRHEYRGLSGQPLPGLILLDLNMPRKDGHITLQEIKKDPDLARIPVVILTTSSAEEDIRRTYGLGVNSFITKPVTFEGLCDVVKTIHRYWMEVVALPPECQADSAWVAIVPMQQGPAQPADDKGVG